jgi:hypothetical protein
MILSAIPHTLYSGTRYKPAPKTIIVIQKMASSSDIDMTYPLEEGIVRKALLCKERVRTAAITYDVLLPPSH